MSRWGPKPRTKADFERDCMSWCASARREMVEAIADEDLARRHNVPLQFAKYHRALRLQKAW